MVLDPVISVFSRDTVFIFYLNFGTNSNVFITNNTNPNTKTGPELFDVVFILCFYIFPKVSSL